MNAKTMVAMALMVFGAGCASSQMARVPVLDVDMAQRDMYWTPKKSSTTTSHKVDPKRMATLVIVQYVIDAKGKVRDAKVLRAEPSTADARWALKAVGAFAFVPTEQNAGRQPVRTQHEVELQHQVVLR